MDDRPGQALGKAIGGECRAQEARKRDADLNGREELCRILQNFEHLFCLFVAVIGGRTNLFFVERDHCDLGCGKEGIE